MQALLYHSIDPYHRLSCIGNHILLAYTVGLKLSKGIYDFACLKCPRFQVQVPGPGSSFRQYQDPADNEALVTDASWVVNVCVSPVFNAEAVT